MGESVYYALLIRFFKLSKYDLKLISLIIKFIPNFQHLMILTWFLFYFILFYFVLFNTIISFLFFYFILFYLILSYFILFYIILFFAGVCDCCDGSDEIWFLGFSNSLSKDNSSGNIPGISNHCVNTCEIDLLSIRQRALVFHKRLQDGLKAKREIIGAYELKKKKESKYVLSILSHFSWLLLLPYLSYQFFKF